MAAILLEAVGNSGRRNQYFLPGGGIEREVIQSDICRYLDNDATIKPGEYNGEKGFLLYAYRNLTSSMVEDIKADSQKLREEREARDQRNKSSANKKRKHEQPAPLSYIDSKTHSQTVQRFEEQEQERQRIDSPISESSRGFPVLATSGFTGLPTPASQRGDVIFPAPPHQSYTASGRVKDGLTPPHTTTPDSQYSHPSSDGRPNYDRNYQQDPYRQEPYSPQYAPQYAQQPNMGRSVPQSMAPPPLPAIQQLPRASAQSYYDPYAMDTTMDTRPDYRDPRPDHRPDWPDSRMDPRLDHLESRMDNRPDPRTDPRLDPYMDARSARPDMGSMDVRVPTRMEPRVDPRADPRMERPMGTRMDMRGEARQEARYEGRGDPRDSRGGGERYRQYSESDRRRR